MKISSRRASRVSRKLARIDPLSPAHCRVAGHALLVQRDGEKIFVPVKVD